MVMFYIVQQIFFSLTDMIVLFYVEFSNGDVAYI